MKNYVLFVLTIGLLIPAIKSTSQNFTYSDFEIINATFSGGNLPIRKDEDASFYGVPHWISGEENQIPVAYISGNSPRVMANFTLTCPSPQDSVLVRGIAANGMIFPTKKVRINAMIGDVHTFNYPSTLATTSFETEITRFFKSFAIGWDVSVDHGTTWHNIDSTKNTLYVTRSAPQSEAGHFKYYRSVYDISCRNADGFSTDKDVIAAVWSEYTDQVTLNYKGDSLFYYKTLNTFNTNLGTLLSARNAQCYTFAQLFLATIKIQGIVRKNNYVYFTPVYSTTCDGYAVNRFLVNDWSFGSPTGAGCASYPYENTYSVLIPYPYDAYSFITSDVKDMDGIPGQNNTNPSSFFNNHQIAYIDGIYYDACYGISFESFDAIPYEALSGWGFIYTSGGVSVARFTNDMGATKLSQSITTF